MNLNKRDLHCYRNFLNQVKIGYNNNLLDNSCNYIISFIENKYNSTDFTTFTLEDFIQECFKLILDRKTTINSQKLERLYSKLKDKDNKQNVKEYIPFDDYSIDYDGIYFKTFVNDFLNMISSENKRNVIKDIIINNDLHIDNKKYGVTRTRMSQIKDETFRRIKWNKDFLAYYEDYIFDANMYYNYKMRTYSLREYVENNNYRKEYKDLLLKYIDDADSLTKEELEKVYNVLIRMHGFFYNYHKNEVIKHIKKIRHKIFIKSID